MPVSATLKIRVQFSAGVWTEIQSDVVAIAGLDLKYGIDGNGPLDKAASTGELKLTLRNDAGNSGGIQGWYSPVHASKRSGWTFGIPIQVMFTSGADTDIVKFRGKIREILPEGGRYASQKVYVTAYDYVRDLMEADVRQVTTQENKTEAELITTILDSLPVDSQPVARSLDAGVDTFPYAFDDLEGGAKAMAIIRDLAVSSFGMTFIKGNGTFSYLNRQSLALSTSVFTFTDNSLHGIAVPSSLDKVFNRIRTTIHPKTLSVTATEILYNLPTNSTVEVGAGATVTVWTDYNDPNDRNQAIGGASVITALVAGTHFSANSLEDGTGINLSSFITPTLVPYSSTAKWTFVNSAGVTAFITLQKVIGKAVRDPGPQTFEAYLAGALGDRPIDIDLPYQNDPYIGQSAADYILASYSNLTQQIEYISFIANYSSTLMAQALLREPGDKITISETVTGLVSVTAIIQSVSFEVVQGNFIRCTWGLIPGNIINFWVLGTAGSSELGETTVLGF